MGNIKATGQFTIIDFTDQRTVSFYLQANQSKIQSYNVVTGTYSPDYSESSTSMIITPKLFFGSSSADSQIKSTNIAYTINGQPLTNLSEYAEIVNGTQLKIKANLGNGTSTVFGASSLNIQAVLKKTSTSDEIKDEVTGIILETPIEASFEIVKLDSSTPGASLLVRYRNSDQDITEAPTEDNIAEWAPSITAPEAGYRTYMTQKLSTGKEWSKPIPISGADGVTPTIGDNGNWYINGTDTGMKAQGPMPTITIGTDGDWYVNEFDTGISALGKDGGDIEYVYCTSKDLKGSPLEAPKYENGQLTPNYWKSSPSGVAEDSLYEYVSVRTKSAGTKDSPGEWTGFSEPKLWSSWGVKGQDGDGVEYIFHLTNESIIDNLPPWNNSDEWKDNPQGVNEENQYEYVIKLKTREGENGQIEVVSHSDPKLWARYSTGASLITKYKNANYKPDKPADDADDDALKALGWEDFIKDPKEGERIYMIQRLSNKTSWSVPFPISGVDGEANVSIGENGNWFINNSDTGKPAIGKDGADIEYVYYLVGKDDEPPTDAPTRNESTNALTQGWSEIPSGISESNPYEYVSVRIKPAGKDWESFSDPVIWSSWGVAGRDGDGVEYKYYLKDDDQAPSYSSSDDNWKDDPQGVSADNRYEYVVQIKTTTAEDGTPATKVSLPRLWAKFGADGQQGPQGQQGNSLIVRYQNNDDDEAPPAPTDLEPSDWYGSITAPKEGERTYMIQRLSNENSWSTPIPITGADGITPTINGNGNWVIDGEHTSYSAIGKDGGDIEFVYYLVEEDKTPPSTAPTRNESTNALTQGWSESPSGISEKRPYEYVSVRTKSAGTKDSPGGWTGFSTPVIWSKWGEKGQDGDGVEYVYYRTTSSSAPDKPSRDNQNNLSQGWEDEPKGVTSTEQYEYVSTRKRTSSGWGGYSDPVLWAKYSEDAIFAIVESSNGKISFTDTETSDITLQAKLYKGGNTITPDSCTWSSIPEGKNGSSSQLTVTRDDITTGARSFTCSMQYNNNSYSDTIVLSDMTDPTYCVIESSNGNVFTNHNVDTILTCRVFKGGDEVDKYEIDKTNYVYKYTWTKKGTTPTQAGSGKTLRINSANVTNKAVFSCTVERQ